MLDRIETAASGGERVSFGEVFRAVGRRSFGPALLLAGLVILAPVVGDIPGVPTIMGIVVLLIAGQLLLRRDCIWLPHWVLDRSIGARKVTKATRWLRKPARFVDRHLRRRLTMFVEGAGEYAIGIVALLAALLTPAMELVPFSANGAGAVLTAFGLALIGRDGLVALVALMIASLTAAAVITALVTG